MALTLTPVRVRLAILVQIVISTSMSVYRTFAWMVQLVGYVEKLHIHHTILHLYLVFFTESIESLWMQLCPRLGGNTLWNQPWWLHPQSLPERRHLLSKNITNWDIFIHEILLHLFAHYRILWTVSNATVLMATQDKDVRRISTSVPMIRAKMEVPAT